ncbi:hypothetical protein [Exiguobacterium artemiae]
MKKFRGKRRYFRQLHAEQHLSAHALDFSSDSWFDFWHIHLDFHGRGNGHLKIRKAHVRALFQLMDELDAALKEWAQPYQLWIELSRLDAGLDAVFIHTNNPNDNNFPFTNPTLTEPMGRLPYYLQTIDGLEQYQIRLSKRITYDAFDDDPEEIMDHILVIERGDRKHPL